MVTVALFSIVSAAGFMLFVVGDLSWSTTKAKAELRQGARKILNWIPLELQESGKDSGGNLQVTILNNAGVNNTDILRFKVPLCVCGASSIDQNGNVKSWGAPAVWGQSGCGAPLVIGANGKVDICHVPPGNPGNPQSLQVSPSSVNAHLAHGDWLGDCNSCSPTAYTNRTVEYLTDADGQILRRVLDTNDAVINSVTIAQNVTDFQASINAPQTVVTLTVQLGKKAKQNKTVTASLSANVTLHNN